MLPKLRKPLAAALASLMLVGGAPRAGCVCLDEECRAACERAGVAFLSTALSFEHSGCQCCKPVAATSPDDAATLAQSSGCPCERFVEQSQLSPAPRDVELLTAPASAWQSVAADAHCERPHLACSAAEIPLRLPPDDPVSRAQILRI